MPPSMDAVKALRHDLHRHPETAGDERGTAERIEAWLEQNGLQPLATDVGGHGLLYRVGEGGPVTLLRADLDGLPLQEDSGVDHASRHDGRHHACGHDGHMAILAGALAGWADQPPEGTVYGLFQPAEETGEGMARCLEDERLGGLGVDRCFAIHNVPGYPAGSVVVRDGVQAVASTGLRIRFEGKTSHAAEPDLGLNPIPAAAKVLPTLLASPRDRREAVAAIVGFSGGGERYGTSAGDAAVYATLRAEAEEDLEAMVKEVLDDARQHAAGAGASLADDRIEPFPTTRNDADAVAAVRRAAKVAGIQTVDPEHPFPWSEDFGHATARWPGALFGLGAGKKHAPVHHPTYDFPDRLLEPGIRMWQHIVEASP